MVGTRNDQTSRLPLRSPIVMREKSAGCEVSQCASMEANFMGWVSYMYWPMVCPPRKTIMLVARPTKEAMTKDRLKNSTFCLRYRWYALTARIIKDAISRPVSYTHLRAHETPEHLVCRL